jgi:GMP synthase (glutamine-hydrolysing)
VHLGHFATILNQQGIPVCHHDLGQPLPAREYRGVIVLGGTMSANDAFPGLDDELRLIEKTVERGTPLLGICLGAQMLAKALGARVNRNPEPEIGWAPVSFTPAGEADRLFRGMASPAPFFHWHNETFDLPAGAEWLAWSGECRHQAYRVAEGIYGIQFHPEVTAEMIADWDADHKYGIDPYAVDQTEAARQILEGWLAEGARGQNKAGARMEAGTL